MSTLNDLIAENHTLRDALQAVRDDGRFDELKDATQRAVIDALGGDPADDRDED